MFQYLLYSLDGVFNALFHFTNVKCRVLLKIIFLLLNCLSLNKSLFIVCQSKWINNRKKICERLLMVCSHLLFVLRFTKNTEPKEESGGRRNILNCLIQSLILRNDFNFNFRYYQWKVYLVRNCVILTQNIKWFSFGGLQKVPISTKLI